MPQTNDQSVGAVGLELVPKLIEDLVELGQVPGPDGWRRECVNQGRSEGWAEGGSEAGLTPSA